MPCPDTLVVFRSCGSLTQWMSLFLLVPHWVVAVVLTNLFLPPVGDVYERCIWWCSRGVLWQLTHGCQVYPIYRRSAPLVVSFLLRFSYNWRIYLPWLWWNKYHLLLSGSQILVKSAPVLSTRHTRLCDTLQNSLRWRTWRWRKQIESMIKVTPDWGDLKTRVT